MAALKAFGEVEQGLDNETLLREQEAHLDVAVSEASETLRIAQDQFDVGRSISCPCSSSKAKSSRHGSSCSTYAISACSSASICTSPSAVASTRPNRKKESAHETEPLV